MLASASPSIQKELTPDTWQACYDACQKGIAQVGAILADVAPDVLMMIGNDQKGLFQDDNMPAMLVYWGDTFHSVPRYGRGQNVPLSIQAAAWAYGEKEQDFPIAAEGPSWSRNSMWRIAANCHLPRNYSVGVTARPASPQALGAVRSPTLWHGGASVSPPGRGTAVRSRPGPGPHTPCRVCACCR